MSGLDEESVEPALPGRHGSQLGAVGVDVVPVELAAARVEVDLLRAEPASALPQEATDPEDNDDGQGEVGLEEALCVVEAATGGADGHVELEALMLATIDEMIPIG
jgi:hypothetical protein